MLVLVAVTHADLPVLLGQVHVVECISASFHDCRVSSAQLAEWLTPFVAAIT